MISIDSLKKFGANTEEGLSRCFGNEEFYITLVKTIPGEATFDKLAESIAQNNLDEAFDHAHALKGVLGNLSLTPILAPVETITEQLRSRTQMDYKPLVDEILSKRDELKAMMED